MRLGLWMGRLRRPVNCEALISKAKATAREPIRTPALKAGSLRLQKEVLDEHSYSGQSPAFCA